MLVGGGADVGLHRVDAVAAIAGRLHQFAELDGITVRDDDRRALVEEPLGNGPTQTGATTGDEGDVALEPPGHWSSRKSTTSRFELLLSLDLDQCPHLLKACNCTFGICLSISCEPRT